MNRIVKILTVGLFLVAMLPSCRKYSNMPYYGYEYTRNDGKSEEFYLKELVKQKGFLGGDFTEPIRGPIFSIIEDFDRAHFYFNSVNNGLAIVDLSSDTNLFYEGVRYHYSGEDWDTSELDFKIGFNHQGLKECWIEFHQGTGSAEFYVQYEMQCSSNSIVSTGCLYFYKRLIEENNVPWRDWIRPAEENKGEKERWIE